ncbi:metalloprotease PmbA [Celerinatantimonas yamalensis]|uniref:Metalloprotease PmbA n=1 Tax=Celerinatantimonas yamalensis TaxID=559956 RepID=A0ABW9GAW6_9GAMM
MSSVQQSVAKELKQLKQAVAFALDEAKRRGASDAEVSISKQTGISVSTRQCEVETLEFNRDGALGIAVYKGQQKGNASTSDLSKEAICRTVQAAVDISEVTSADPATGLAPKEMMATQIPDLDLFYPTELDADRFIEMASACERHALTHQGIRASDGASVNSHYGVRVYGNTHGFVEGFPTSRHSLSCVLIAGESQHMQRDYAYSVAVDFADLRDVQAIADEAAHKTLARLNSRKINTCHVPVIFDKDVAGGLLGHFAMAISGGNLYRRSSFLLDTLGDDLFPKWFSIHEDPWVKKGLGSSPFDNEGVQTRARDIIHQGQLQTYLLTSYAARKMALQPTGHAGGIHNWLVSDSALTQRDLLKQMGTGLLVTELMGQGVNIVTGDYSRGAAGFWVENGEIAYPVHEITIAGQLKDIYQNIVAIGNDRDANHAISVGSILVDSMKIAGS